MVTLLVLLSLPLSLSSCPDSDTSFQLVTGRVFRHPQAIIHTQPGELELGACIESCQQLPHCRSVNYETGLCVTFSTSATEHPDSLVVSEFPVFTMYAERICLVGHCGRAWSYEMVPSATLEGHTRARVGVASLAQCRETCQASTDFHCRSANYHPLTGLCALASVDRHSAPGGQDSLRLAKDSLYIETNCVQDTRAKLCDFKAVKGKILKTVDSVHQGVSSSDSCRSLCLAADYRCHSWDWGETGAGVCRLSHHSRATLATVKQPYLEIQTAVTHELTACYNVSVTCTGEGMVAQVRTSRMFSGAVYSKSRPQTCRKMVRESMDFQLTIGYTDPECDVERDSEGRFTTDVIIQHHHTIVTSEDIGLQVRCNYLMNNTTVHHGLKLSDEMAHPPYTSSSLVGPPNISMRITDQEGGDIATAQVGDPLALRFQIEDRMSPYELFVRELVAMDGMDSSEILLIDSIGCPTDSSIMQALRAVGSAKVLQANFDAFKFPTSQLVQFRALVTPCIPHCEPVDCRGRERTEQSYGRRRRGVQEQGGSKEHELLLANAIHIVDKFQLPPASSEKENEEQEQESGCRGELLPMCLLAAVFLLLQVSLLVIWRACRRPSPPPYTLERDHPYYRATGGKASPPSSLSSLPSSSPPSLAWSGT